MEYQPARGQVVDELSIGVAATRSRLTFQQTSSATEFFEVLCPSQFHQGDCVGGDAQLTALVVGQRSRDLYRCAVHTHPPVDPKLQAHYAPDPVFGDVVYPSLPYLRRNDQIVLASVHVFGFPSDYVERARGSGTWYTIRKARALHVPCTVVFPDGSLAGDLFMQHGVPVKSLSEFRVSLFLPSVDRRP